MVAVPVFVQKKEVQVAILCFFVPTFLFLTAFMMNPWAAALSTCAGVVFMAGGYPILKLWWNDKVEWMKWKNE